ncbi:MAG TPA: PIG-L deacetylase family protein [Acidimicrobiales bacterium]|nr:PIG-L deacetylase family protein [Acidimicrobiales bacterium]
MPPARFSTVPARALAVYAHPDDPEVSCGGTLAAWARGGAEVHLLIATLGEKGTSDPATAAEELAAVRAAEVAAAAEVLGVAGVQQLGHPDGELDRAAGLRGEVVAAVRRIRPDVVVCPDPTAVFFGDGYLSHVDHRAIGWACLDAVAPASSLPLYFPEAGPAHAVGTVLLSGTLDPDVWVDVEEALEAKAAAMRCHRSQLGGAGPELDDLVRARAADEGRRGGLSAAEAFRRLRLRSPG